MDNLHHVFKELMTPMLPPGFQQAPAVQVVQQLQDENRRLQAVLEHLRASHDARGAALRQFNAPPCPAGQFATTFLHHELGELECHLEGELGCPQAEFDPGEPDSAELQTAYMCGRDITDRLTDDEVVRIEIAALAQSKEVA